jgi:hypothetical protein
MSFRSMPFAPHSIGASGSVFSRREEDGEDEEGMMEIPRDNSGSVALAVEGMIRTTTTLRLVLTSAKCICPHSQAHSRSSGPIRSDLKMRQNRFPSFHALRQNADASF